MGEVKLMDKIVDFFRDPKMRKHLLTTIEIILIVVWAFWVGRKYLVLNLYQTLGRGNDDFLISIFPYFPLTRVLHCGDCVLWNGLLNGGSPTFGDTIGALLHPVMVLIMLIFGVMNGIKIAMVAALIMGGLALWWLAKVMKLGILPRLWIALLGVTAGNLAGPLYSGDVGIVFSVAATGLVIAPGLALVLSGRRRDAIIFGLVLAQALLSGQGYLQLALMGCVLPVFLIFIFDSEFRPNPIWKEFAIALVIAVLISAVFILPALSFSSKIVKPSEPQSAQPLEYLPLNLVVRDTNFFLSTDLQKLASPNLYENYIGWIPIILAVIALRFIPPKAMRIYLFFVIGIFLIYLLGSSLFFGWIRSWLHSFLSDIRNPTFGIGLAVVLILGLAAWGLDLFMKLNWPSLELTSNQNKSIFRVDSRIILLPLLFWSIKVVYQYNDQFHFTIPWPENIVRAAESLSPNPAGWVRPIYGNWTFTAAAVNHNIKITNGYRIWDMIDRPYPTMSIDVGTDPNMVTDPHYSHSVGDVFFAAYPENPYAYIDTGSDKIPCAASADGGHIDVVCKSEQTGTLIVQENAFAGWTAWRDGKKLDLVPGQWLSASTPAGEHSFKFRYHPWDFPIGALLSFVGFGLAIWLWFRPQPAPITSLASLND